MDVRNYFLHCKTQNLCAQIVDHKRGDKSAEVGAEDRSPFADAKTCCKFILIHHVHFRAGNNDSQRKREWNQHT